MNKPEVLKACNQMKNFREISNDQLPQVMAIISHEMQQCLLQKDTLRQQIQRAKRVCDEVEPKTLRNLKLLDVYSTTRSGQPFAKDIVDRGERILIFTTPENLKWLQGPIRWIIAETFKTLPILFR